MTIQIDADRLDAAVRRYEANEPLRTIAADCGVSKDVLSRHLRERGVVLRAKTNRPRPARKVVSAAEFVAAWLAAPTVNAVEDATGLAPSAVWTRARDYRELGVRLPHRPRIRKGTCKTDATALNAMIDAAAEADRRAGRE